MHKKVKMRWVVGMDVAVIAMEAVIGVVLAAALAIVAMDVALLAVEVVLVVAVVLVIEVATKCNRVGSIFALIVNLVYLAINLHL